MIQIESSHWAGYRHCDPEHGTANKVVFRTIVTIVCPVRAREVLQTTEDLENAAQLEIGPSGHAL
jgi:hypothetical protein